MPSICFLSTPQNDGWDASSLKLLYSHPTVSLPSSPFYSSFHSSTVRVKAAPKAAHVVFSVSDFCICDSLKRIGRGKGPTCCPAVFAHGELELLLDRSNFEVVVHGEDFLRAQAQVEPQLVLSGSVGELIYLIQT